METVTALFVAAIGAFLLIVGIGKADCMSDCIAGSGGIQCSSCDSPTAYHDQSILSIGG